jgi:cobalt-zinc-cadmium resistance protein CzcA
LRSWRAALITLLVVPISFLLTLNVLACLGYTGNLMSLGALDFGLIIDGAVVIIDNILLRLRQRQQELGRTLELQERRLLIQQASQEVSSPMVVGWFIILIAYLPGLSLESIEGQMLYPLALTALLALAVALPLSLSLVPILCLWIQRAPAEPVLTQKWTITYLNFLGHVFRHRWSVLLAVVAIAIGSVVVGLHLGVDLFPVLNEGSTVLEVQRPPTVNLAESLAAEQETERALQSAFPEIKHIFARIGFSDIATDPQSPNQNDIYISYRPAKDWRPINNHIPTKAELESGILAEARKRFPAAQFGLSQPIRLRFDEALEGVRSAFVVKLFGPDLDRLSTLTRAIQSRLERLPGVESVISDPVETIASEQFQSDRLTMARYLVKSSEIDQVLSVGIAGREIGRVDEAESFYPIIVRLPQTLQLADLANMPVRSAEGNLMLTLGQLGRFQQVVVPNFVYHESGFRRRIVTVNLNWRDLGGFAESVRSLLAREIKLQPGERIEYGGNYRLLSESIERLKWLVPLTVGSFLLLLALFLRSLTRALIAYSALPFALVGGIASLALSGMSLTLSAGIGLLAVGGIALLNKVVFMHHYGQLRAQQVPVLTAIQETTRRRLRPILTTAAVAMTGFVPMLLSNELGAEVQRPIATVVIGGLFTSTVVTLVILPLLLFLWDKAEGDRDHTAKATPRELSTVAGT